MPERDLPRVAVGQPARLTSAYDDSVWSAGTIARVAPVVDPTSGIFRVTIEISPDQRSLRPGQFVTIDLEVDRRRDVLTVPKRALVYEDGAPVLYVVGTPDPVDADDEDADDEDARGEGSWPPSWWPFGAEAPAEDTTDDDDDDDDDDDPVRVAERTAVRLGLIDDQYAQVLEGIDAGAEVVVVGQTHLRDGARVRTPRSDDGEVDATPEPE
jgi:membrane fusion protein (multidrug efflux system)